MTAKVLNSKLDRAAKLPLAFVQCLVLCVVLAAVLAMNAHAETTTKNGSSAAGNAATRTTVDAINSTISSGLIGGAGVFRIRLGEGPTPELSKGMAASFDSSNLSIWFTPVLTRVDNKIAPLYTEGSVNLLMGGIEYNHEDTVIMGVSLTRDWANMTSTEISTTTSTSAVTGLGYTLAPYVAWQLNPSWLLDASFGAGNSQLESTKSDGTVASPQDERSFVSMGATYLKPLTDKAMFTGKSTLSRSRDFIDTFNSTQGTTVTSNSSSATYLNQLKLGGQLSYRLGSFTPYAGGYYIQNDFTVDSTSSVKPVEYQTVSQWVAGLNFSTGPVYGALAFQQEQGRTQSRLYLGYRF